MAEIETEIESRLKRISENEARIAALMKKLWDVSGAPNAEALRQEELGLRQHNLTLRREIAELKTKLPK